MWQIPLTHRRRILIVYMTMEEAYLLGKMRSFFAAPKGSADRTVVLDQCREWLNGQGAEDPLGWPRERVRLWFETNQRRVRAFDLGHRYANSSGFYPQRKVRAFDVGRGAQRLRNAEHATEA
jgi:hypothetical protein